MRSNKFKAWRLQISDLGFGISHGELRIEDWKEAKGTGHKGTGMGHGA